MRFDSVNKYLPSDIHRKIRSLDNIKRWKGSEFRTFLLYVGVVVLRDVLPTNEYTHFLKLNTAVTICSTNVYKRYLPKARDLFLEYIEEYIEIFGAHSVSSNFHNLCHVVDDVERFGELHGISTYQFENELHHIKLLLKQCNKPLEQIARRLGERSVSKTYNPSMKFEIEVKYPFTLTHSSQSTAFKQILYKNNCVLSNRNDSEKNCWFLFDENGGVHIAKFSHSVFKQGAYFIYGSPLENIESFFSTPFDSRHLFMFKSNGALTSMRCFDLKMIKTKLFCLPQPNGFVFMPLLHTF